MDMLSLYEAVVDQVDVTQRALPEMERDEVLRVWLATGRMIADLRLLRADVETRALALIERDERVVLDGAAFGRGWKSGTRNAWDHVALAQEVAVALGAPVDIIEQFLEVAHVDYWRTTGLEALGIDPDEYCKTTPGRPALDAIQ